MSADSWICPVHAFAYGDGVPNPLAILRACSTCQQEAREAEHAWRADHGRFAWWNRSSGVPARYRAALPELIEPNTRSAKALQAVVSAYCNDLDGAYRDGRGLVLLGPPGLGKTLAACAIVNSACRRWRGPIYCAWPEVTARIKRAFAGPKDDPDRHLVDQLIEAPLLALDELGVSPLSQWEHAELFRLIDSRYSDQLPTTVCSNASQDAWPAAVGERIADRLRECGPVVALAGESQRGRLSCTGPDALTKPAETLSTRVHTLGHWAEKTHRID